MKRQKTGQSSYLERHDSISSYRSGGKMLERRQNSLSDYASMR